MLQLRRLVVGVSLLTSVTAWSAEEQLDWAQPYAGEWTLAGVSEGDPYCGLTFGTEGVIGGASLEISATCQRNFPLEEVAGWTLRDENLVLIDALRQAVMTFEPQGDFFMAMLPEGEVLSLDRGHPLPPASRASLLDGTFTLSGPNNTEPCGFAVSATSNNGGELEQVGLCPQQWKSQPWRRWTFEDNELHLVIADGTALLSLKPSDGFTFVAETPDGPLYFGPGYIEVPR